MRGEEHVFEAPVTRVFRLPYLLYLPADYGQDPGRVWPFILFLHGAGERGSDPNLIREYGLPTVAEADRRFPFVVLAPQCPAGSRWEMQEPGVDALCQDIIARYAVDRRRVYLTGLSMGGFGAWSFAAAHPDRFAALAPICGGGAPMLGFPRRVSLLKNMPVWVFHGARDNRVPLAESQTMVDALRAAGGNVQFTIYPEAGHDSWTETYNNPALYEWLLQQSLPG